MSPEARARALRLFPLPLHLAARLPDYYALSKPGILGAVLMTTLSGFLLGSGGRQPSGWLLFHTILGTALVAVAAGSLNMLLEIDSDRTMDRTKLRPLAAGRLKPHEAFFFGILCGAFGIVHLAAMVGVQASFLACLSLMLYLSFYTPLKRTTSLCTVVGAVSGALPPLIGWAGSGAPLNAEAWSLFFILFIWQFPHLLALSWLYRADYARGGFRMFPVQDATGRWTASMTLAGSAALIPTALLPVWFGSASGAYAAVSLALNGALIAQGIRFYRRLSSGSARTFFLATVFYLPVLLIALVCSGAAR